MDILKELVQVVTKNKVKRIEIVGNSEGSDSLVQQFYEGIHSGKFETDAAAASYFFHSDEKDPRYKRLKSSTKKRLLNTIFFIDLKKPSYTEQQRAYYTCCKEWAAAKVLFGKQVHQSALDICKRVLSKAIKFEFSELALDVTRMLRTHYGTRMGNAKKFNHYNRLFKKYEKAWIAENLAEELYGKLIIEYISNKKNKEALHQLALEYSCKLDPYLKTIDTYRLHLSGNLIKVLAWMSLNEYQKTLEVCKEAITFFESKPFVSSVSLQVFLHQQLVCYTQLNEYRLGRESAEKCLSYLQEGSFNWFKLQELYFTLSMHTGEYQQAYRIYNSTVHHRRFSYLPDAIAEIWTINKAYVYFLVFVGRIDLPKDDQAFNKFRVGKFLNEVPGFSKDKRRMNIPILVIQILLLIAQKKYDLVVDRIEAVEKYCFRYLRKDESYRSNCFIRMLLQIPISGFHKSGVIRRAQKYLDLLQSVPLEVANQTHEVEIIPYEELWQFALDMLDIKFIRNSYSESRR